MTIGNSLRYFFSQRDFYHAAKVGNCIAYLPNGIAGNQFRAIFKITSNCNEDLFKPLVLIAVAVLITSCHTLSSGQTFGVKKFATTSKEVSDLPYKILCNYYSIGFKANRLDPGNYVIKDTLKEGFDQLTVNAILKIEAIRKDYYRNLRTAGDVKVVYELLQTYISSLEKFSDYKYAKDFENKSI
jgi:hypothetical protein